MNSGQHPPGFVDQLLRAWVALSIVIGAWLLAFAIHV
jgi:hypothetical protein